MHIRNRILDGLSAWLTREKESAESPLCDFERLRHETRLSDVLLVEGRSRVSEVIKNITQSTWTHAALYIGRLYDIEDEKLRTDIAQHYDGDPSVPLVIEALLGEGTIIVPLAKYEGYHLRICRPKGLTHGHAVEVIRNAVSHAGKAYDLRQLLDLARFMFPWGWLPRRWRSSLFEHSAGAPTRTVCSSMIASAFASVRFPILPVIQRDDTGNMRLYRRNDKLFVPRDFDHSPYFEIIKYPLLGLDDLAAYQRLPWDNEGLICNAEGDCFNPVPVVPEEAPASFEADSEQHHPARG